MNRYLDLGDCPELESWSLKYMLEGRSFKAINSAGEIIGVIINGLMHRHHADDAAADAAEPVLHAKFAIILRLMDYVDTQFDLFERFPQYDRALDAKIITVNDAYRGAGIAKALTQHTAEYMRANGLALFHVMCSSHYSALLCDRLGFEKVYEMLYSDYVLPNGVRPVLPAEPHTAMRLYARCV